MAERTMYLLAGDPGARKLRGADPIIKAVFQGTGVPKPKVAYVGAASGDNAAFLLFIGSLLKRSGAGSVTLAPLCGRRGSLERARPVLEGADVVFVSGGDVEAGMQVLAETGAARYLQRLYRAGKPFFGISAGSIMLARQWVRWSDPEDDASAQLFPCLGIAPVLCDTHGEGDGWAELKAMLALCPVGATGYGIVSGSALLVRGRSEAYAAGGAVHVFRRRKAGVVRVNDLASAARAGT